MKFKYLDKMLVLSGAALLTAGAIMPVNNAQASGFESTLHSAEGLGRAYAGEGAVTNNASALARNPAAAVEVPDKSLSISAIYVKPDTEHRGDVAGVLNADADDVADESVVPAIAYTQRLGNKIGVGVALKTDYGSAVRYRKDHPAVPGAGETELTTINLGLNAAYKVTPKLSAGIGVHVVRADAELSRYSAGTEVINLDGDDTAVTWSAGAIYKAAPGHQYSVSYREKTRLELDGDGFVAVALGGTGNKVDAELDIDLPEILQFSGTNKVADKTSVQYSITATRWDRVDSLDATQSASGAPLFSSPQNRVNSRRYALGVTHELNDKMTVRAGIARDNESQKSDERHLSTIDADRIWYTTGMSYRVCKDSTMDLGLAYVKLDDVTVDNANLAGGAPVDIKQKASGILVGAQYNRKF